MAPFFFSVAIHEATASINVMQMLAEQAETNISRALSDADKPGAIKSGEFADERGCEDGQTEMFQRTYYTCGSCVGYDEDEVKSDYKHLIAQLTRRSAFLTIFSLFEHNMLNCLALMDSLSGNVTDKKRKTLEDCHARLKKSFSGGDIKDVDHLLVIRNIMAHSNGVAEGYKQLCLKSTKKTDAENRLLRAIKRAESEGAGVSANDFNGLLMYENFLFYVVREFKRYAEALKASVLTAYYENH